MKSLFRMVGLLLKDSYRLSSNERKGGKIAVAAVIAVIYLVFEYAMITASIDMAGYFNAEGMVPEFLTAVMVMGLTVIPVFGIMPMLNMLYFSKDAEFYLSLPVMPSKVYFAKLITVYISQLVITVAVLLPMLFAAGITIGLNWVFFVVIIFAVLFLPAISLMVLSVVCVPLMYLIRFFKNRGAASSVMTMILFVAIFFAYMALISSNSALDVGEQLGNALKEPVKRISDIFIPIHAIARFATFVRIEPYSEALSMLFNFFIFMVPMLLLFAITMVISRKAYSSAVSMQLEGRRATGGTSSYRGGSGKMKALVTKEWKGIVRTPIFTLQCFMGLIIAPIVLIIAGFGGERLELGLEPHIQSSVVWLGIGMFLQMLIVSVNIGASTTFSRDGKALYLIKLMPVSYGTVIRSKVAFYNIVYGADITLCFIVQLITTGFAAWWTGFIVWLYLLTVDYGFISLCVTLDLSRPKLDWMSYREIVKNSRNAMLPAIIGTLVSLAVGGASIAIFIVLSSKASIGLATGIVAVMLIGGALAFAFIVRNILYSKANSYFERIEV